MTQFVARDKRNLAMKPIRCLLTQKLGILWMLLLTTMFIFSFGQIANAAPDPAKKGDLYAVIVGVSKYGDPNIPQLTLSDKDAKDLYSFIDERKSLFRKTNVHLFLNEQATRANVSKALRDDLKPAGKDDIVLIYMSGHGAADQSRPDEYYFITHDTQIDNLYGTALWMNQNALFKGIDSDRVLLLSDACHSGGFNPGLEKTLAKEADTFFSMFQNLKGRIGISSSRSDEKSYEQPKFGNSIFTHFLLKALRGEASKGSGDGSITAKQLYDYIYEKTRQETKNAQSPQLFCPKGLAQETTVFRAPTFEGPLRIRVSFVSKDDSERESPLTNESVLKSGSRIGISFQPESDCYVYIFWWDSSGQVGKLFPNPQLTEGSGEARGGQTYWLPSKQGKYWYVLDNNPGVETIYFVASRQRNPKIETLYDKLNSLSASGRSGKAGKEISDKLEREFNIMGIADYTVPDKSVQAPQGLLEALENEIKVVGADASYSVQFRHIPK